jgi:hypothetical protein
MLWICGSHSHGGTKCLEVEAECDFSANLHGRKNGTKIPRGWEIVGESFPYTIYQDREEYEESKEMGDFEPAPWRN